MIGTGRGGGSSGGSDGGSDGGTRGGRRDGTRGGAASGGCSVHSFPHPVVAGSDDGGAQQKTPTAARGGEEVDGD